MTLSSKHQKTKKDRGTISVLNGAEWTRPTAKPRLEDRPLPSPGNRPKAE